MVGQRSLTPLIKVRALVRQPFFVGCYCVHRHVKMDATLFITIRVVCFGLMRLQSYLVGIECVCLLNGDNQCD